MSESSYPQSKTQAEIENQWHLVEAARSKDYRRFHYLGVEDDQMLTPDELLEKVGDERHKAERYGCKSLWLAEYDEYVSELRQLRQSQREQITHAMEEAVDPAERRAAYLKSVQFSGEMQRGAVDKMNRGYHRLFSQEEIERVAVSKEDFLQALEKTVTRSARTFLDSFNLLQNLVPPDKLRHFVAVAAALEPNSLLDQYHKIQPLYQPEERKDLMDRALEADLNPTRFRSGQATLRAFSQEAVRAMYTPDEISAKLEQALSEGDDDWVLCSNLDHIDAYIKQGYLTREALCGHILNFVKTSRYSGLSVAAAYEHFFADDSREKLKTQVCETSESPDCDLDPLTKMGDLLSDEEKAGIVRRRLAAHPSDLGFKFDAVRKLLPREEVRTAMHKAIQKRDYAVFQFFKGPEIILQSDYLDDDEKRAYLAILFAEYPDEAASEFDTCVAFIPEEERPSRIKSILENATPKSLIRHSDEWLEYYSADPVAQKEKLRDLIMYENDFQFVETYQSDFSGKKLKGLFAKEEIHDLLDQQLDLGVGGLVHSFDKVADFVSDEGRLRNLVTLAAASDPGQLLWSCDKWAYLFTNEEIQSLVSSMAGNGHVYECLNHAFQWRQYVSEAFIPGLVASFKDAHASALLGTLRMWYDAVPQEQLQPLVSELVVHNPAAAIMLIDVIQRTCLPDINENDIERMTLQDKNLMELAPKSIGFFFRELKTRRDETARSALFLEANDTFEHLNKIKRQNLDKPLLDLYGKTSPSFREEKEMLAVFYSLASLKEIMPDAFSEERCFGESLAETSGFLLTEVAGIMGIDQEVGEAEQQRFFEAFGTPAPFVTHYLQHRNSLEHAQILRGIFSAVLRGDFPSYKYGENSDAGLQILKDKHLLPQGLTLEQYRLWQTDESSSSFDVLAADSRSVRNKMRELIEGEAHHLGLEKVSSESLQEIREESRLVGADIGQISKRISQARRTGEPDEMARISEWEQERVALIKLREQLVYKETWLKLWNISIDDITAGRFAEGGGKGERLQTVLHNLRSQVPAEGMAIITNLEGYLASFVSQDTTRQKLTCTDTGDSRITLEIGARPVSSCQHYAHGVYNNCLLGYFGPETKLTVLRNENDNLVSRAVTRILSINNNQGEPALHMERIYTTCPSPTVDRVMIGHLFSKAERMGMRIFISQKAQNEEGTEIEMQAPPGFELISVPEQLVSEAAVAPLVYVDSAGGVKNKGAYKMRQLFEVRRVAEAKSAS